MDLTAWLPLFASVISLFFAGHLVAEWRKTHREYNVWWAIAFLLYTVAAFGEFYSLAFGFTSLFFKIYYFSAMSLVGCMAVGEGFIITRLWIARVFMGIMLIFMILLVFQLAKLGPISIPGAVHMTAADALTAATSHSQFPMLARIWGILLSSIGGTVLILGPIWSWFRTKRLMALWIAVGAIVLSSAGSLEGLGHPVLLPLSELVGVAIMYYGVLHGASAKNAS